jgi:putative transposase
MHNKAVKLTIQVKLQPTSEQSDALLRTLETANKVCDRLSEIAWEAKQFGQYKLQQLSYHQIRKDFPLTAQMVVRMTAKVADAYKLDHDRKRSFRPHGSIAYDLRILSWNMAEIRVSIWSMDGRLAISFVCGERQRQLLDFQRGETDLVYRDGFWFLFTTVDIPDIKEYEALDWIGVDLGIVNIAVTSDGTKFAGATINSRRARNARLRQKLQKKGTRSAKRLLRKRRRKERRFATDVNHCISKQLVDVAKRTGRGLVFEDLKHIRTRLRIRANKTQRRRLHSWAFGQLQTFSAYKAKRGGVPVRFVDPRNTSRICPVCGCADKRNRKTRDIFLCVCCGHTKCADANASRNISRRAEVNQPNVTGVDALGVHSKKVRVAKRSLVTSPAL